MTLFARPASAGEPPDELPPAGAGLAELLEARAAGELRWPRAHQELREILAGRARLKAALADTVSALHLVRRHDQIKAAAHEDSLRAVIRWQGYDLEAMHARRQRWYQSPSVLVPLTVLATIWAVDVVVSR